MIEDGVSWWSDWFPKTETIAYYQIGRDIKTGKEVIRYKTIEEHQNAKGRGRRGRDRKEQPQCSCSHFTYEHKKGKCTKCDCEKFKLK